MATEKTTPLCQCEVFGLFSSQPACGLVRCGIVLYCCIANVPTSRVMSAQLDFLWDTVWISFVPPSISF